MNRKIGNRRHGEIELHRLPARAIVERNINAGFGSRVKQPALVRIFANHARERAIGNPVRDLLPRLAVVIRLVQVRFVIVILVHRRGDVSCACVEGAGIERINLNPFRHHAARRSCCLSSPGLGISTDNAADSSSNYYLSRREREDAGGNSRATDRATGQRR